MVMSTSVLVISPGIVSVREALAVTIVAMEATLVSLASNSLGRNSSKSDNLFSEWLGRGNRKLSWLAHRPILCLLEFQGFLHPHPYFLER